MPELDDANLRILRALQRDGSLRNDELAERIGLSPSPTLRRVRALEEAGYIRYVGLLNRAKINLTVQVMVELKLLEKSRDALDRFNKEIVSMPEVTDCMTVLGEWDYILMIVARDIEDYQRFLLDKLAKLPNIANYRSTMIIHEVKKTTELPL